MQFTRSTLPAMEVPRRSPVRGFLLPSLILAMTLFVSPLSTLGQSVIIRAVPAIRASEPPGPAEQNAAPDDGAASAEAPTDGTVPPQGEAAPGPATKLSKDEIASLKQLLESLPKDRQDEMKAYYKDLGLDLDQALGIASAASAAAMRFQEAMNTMRELDFARTPKNVLSARAKLGFGQVPQPDPATARGSDIARWVHLQVMAGEWSAFAKFLDNLPQEHAESIYAAVLQSLNRGNSGMLPEEVLALAEASPSEPKEWQSQAWANMLKAAAARNSPGPLLDRIRAGTRFFGTSDSAKRHRTVELLAGAGLLEQAYEFLPPLADARAAGDGDLVLVHARYQAELADKAGQDGGGDEHRDAAWALYSEVATMPRASMTSRREAIRLAVGMMSEMPRASVQPWLTKVFDDDALGPAALEAIAVRASEVGDAKGSEAEKAQSILSLKEAVDILLKREGLDRSVLRVPMRMLTTALVAEMEQAVNKKGAQQTISVESQLLVRAIPSDAWLNALEPSLAARAGKACVEIATVAGETDTALNLLVSAIRRSPDQAREIADAFLKAWQMRLSPKSDVDNDTMMYYFWREYVAQAPLTRGRQRRNLDRLGRLIKTLADIGVDARQLPDIVPVFKACHGITEVYERSDIERVFGSVDQVPAATAATLAASMAASLNGDWRNRAVQVQQGVKRTDNEIAELVDRGYGLAIELADRALAAEPDSWRFSVLKAGLAYDRLQFRALKSKGDAAKNAEYRAAAFAAFADAAKRYAAAVTAGTEREDADVYIRWFGAAMGTSQLNFISADELPGEGTAPSDQVDLIRAAINSLPPDIASRQISDFARAVSSAVSRSDPEVKPRLVKQALRVVGDHPAGAPLRALDELYRDLVKDEIKLRLTLDGDDRVGLNRPFGLLVALRFTNSVDRETGGFSKYLQTSAYVRVGRQYQEVNFRDKLQKNIEGALGKGFAIESIGFFDPFMPSRGVVENGQDGWLEKPLAYVVVSRKDPAADRLPQINMEMQFEDQTGPVTLVLPSNTPPLAVGDQTSKAHQERPCEDLKITQVVDPRDARDRQKDETIKLEIIARGKGAIPELSELITGYQSAIAGYEIKEGGVEVRPTSVVQEGGATSGRFGWGPQKPPEGGYPEPDAGGMYRLPVERSWMITYTPTAGPRASEFHLAALRDGVHATLDSRYFSDYDLVPVAGELVPVGRTSMFWPVALGVVALLAVVATVFVIRRRRPTPPLPDTAIVLPDRITPLSTVMALRRLSSTHAGNLDADRRDLLNGDIAAIELKYFGPGNDHDGNGDLRQTLERWAKLASSNSR